MPAATPYFAPLPVHALAEKSLNVVRAESHAELEDPAWQLMTDLRVAPAVVVPASETLGDTRRLMQLAGVRMAFVINAADAVVGLVTLDELQGERPAQLAAPRGISSQDVAAGEVMAPISTWATVDLADLVRARVGHIVASFHATGWRYLIVIETVRDTDALGRPQPRHLIRGLFSANRVERALGEPIAEELRSRTFAELAAALARV